MLELSLFYFILFRKTWKDHILSILAKTRGGGGGGGGLIGL